MKNILITQLYNTLKTKHPDDAAEVLLELLISGKVPASASDPQNDDNVVLLNKHHWQSLTPERVTQIFREGNAPIKQEMRYGPVEFQMHIFVPEWSLSLLPPAETPAPMNLGGKRGATPAIEWPVVWIGIVHIMSQPNRPKTQAELIEKISLWCQNNFSQEAPGLSTLKENLFGLFQIMAGESPKIVFPKGSRPKRKSRKTPRK